jgi:hypothetical protein
MKHMESMRQMGDAPFVINEIDKPPGGESLAAISDVCRAGLCLLIGHVSII